MIKAAPSILAADPLDVGSGVERMLGAGCDWIHVDIMDAHFVPNLSYGPAIVKALRERWPELDLDVHLMMDDPEDYLKTFAEQGASGITIHAEVPGDVAAMLEQIRGMGLRAGLSVKPGTPVESIRALLPLCDMVLVMTVEPGFGGQRFRMEMLDKLTELRAMGYTGLIEADGGVGLSNLPLLAERGLDVAVMGTALFRCPDPADYIRQVHAL